MKLIHVWLWLLLSCTTCSICGYSQTSNSTWHKLVYRVIDLAEKKYIPHHYQKISGADTTLIKLIDSALFYEELTAYNLKDITLNTRLTKQQIYGPAPVCILDTVFVVDPVTGEERVVPRPDPDFFYLFIHQYRILENWTFEPATGKTEMQIIAIAPIKEVYNEKKVLLGSQSLFWLKYSDLKDLIARYDRLNPSKTFASIIWDDYFLSDIKPQVVK